MLKVHSTAPPQHIKLIPAEGEGMARQVQSAQREEAKGVVHMVALGSTD